MVDDNSWCQFSEWLYIPPVCSNSYMYEGGWSGQLKLPGNTGTISLVTSHMYCMY